MIYTANKTITFMIGDSECSLPVEIDYRWEPGVPGLKEASTGLPIEPDSPPEAEIVAVRCHGLPLAKVLPAEFWREVEDELAEEHEE